MRANYQHKLTDHTHVLTAYMLQSISDLLWISDDRCPQQLHFDQGSTYTQSFRQQSIQTAKQC